MKVKPTRMALLETKKKLELAEKGHDLLEEKRDTLVMEFFETLKEIKEHRKELGEELSEADEELLMAQMQQGEQEIERKAKGLSGDTEVEFSTENIMSVEVPKLEEVNISPEWYSVVSSSTYLESAVKKYREIAPKLLKVVELQLKLNSLAEEIKTTKRRVNSLEHLTMPKLEKIRDEISFKLEERERENFIKLKMIKSKKEEQDED